MARLFDTLANDKTKVQTSDKRWVRQRPKKQNIFIRLFDAIGIVLGIYDAVYYEEQKLRPKK